MDDGPGAASPTRSVEVLGHRMAYREAGHGDPVVLLHGNPTSSYLWRRVIPELSDRWRCVAPDLIGMGASDKLTDSGHGRYRFAEHRRFLDAFLEAVGVHDAVTLVVHDWGSALGFDWAHRHPDAVVGVAHMESLVAPLTWSDWPAASHEIFRAMRSPVGDEICLEKNVFVERILPASVLRELTDAEMDVYRAPYREPGEDRRPTVAWPRELPIDGEPADVDAIVRTYAGWLADGEVPKLYVRADPGFLTPLCDRHARGWAHQSEVTVRGLHFLQEDSPTELGRAIAGWRAGLT